MKSLRLIISTLLGTLAALTSVEAAAAPLTDAQKTFLAKYEPVRAALAADDLEIGRASCRERV